MSTHPSPTFAASAMSTTTRCARPWMRRCAGSAGCTPATGPERIYPTSLHPTGRLGTSEDVARLAAFLLPDRAAFITGGFHLIDGGYAAR